MDAGLVVALVLLGLLGLYALFVVVNPRGTWKVTEAWQYRNPDAVEPSRVGFGLNQLGALVGLIAILVGIGIIVANNQAKSDALTQEAECELAEDILTSSDPAAAAAQQGWTVEQAYIFHKAPVFGGNDRRDYYVPVLKLLDGDRPVASYEEAISDPFYMAADLDCPMPTGYKTWLPTLPPPTPTPTP